ncbi:hypothetical protein CVD23_11270 [Bacillus sp. V33-4]|nr:hypothetical protein CVD23_11270 [Bacillus sp. V33-4]
MGEASVWRADAFSMKTILHWIMKERWAPTGIVIIHTSLRICSSPRVCNHYSINGNENLFGKIHNYDKKYYNRVERLFYLVTLEYIVEL